MQATPPQGALSLSISVSPSGVKVSERAIADRLCSSGVRPSPRVACSGPGVAGRPWPLSRSFHQWRMGQARGKEDIRHCQPCYWRKTCLHHSGSAGFSIFKTIVLTSFPFSNLPLLPPGVQEDADLAVGAAKKAYESWSKLPGHVRARHLYSIARHVQKHAR